MKCIRAHGHTHSLYSAVQSRECTSACEMIIVLVHGIRERQEHTHRTRQSDDILCTRLSGPLIWSSSWWRVRARVHNPVSEWKHASGGILSAHSSANKFITKIDKSGPHTELGSVRANVVHQINDPQSQICFNMC